MRIRFVLSLFLVVIVTLAVANSTIAGPKFKFRFKVTKQGKLELPGPVLFETGKDRLLPESDPVLAHVKKFLDTKPDVSLLRIGGHTELGGDAAKNMDLSKRRAMAVSRWLISKGVSCTLILPIGHGSTKPVVKPEKAPEDKYINRRIEFVQVHLKGKAIPGITVDGGGEIAGDPCGN